MSDTNNNERKKNFRIKHVQLGVFAFFIFGEKI